MNPSIIKPSIAVWLLLATSSLQAWQGDGEVHTNRSVEGGSIIITWSKNNDEIRSFSSTLGEWETLWIERPNAIAPIVGSNVAVVRIGDSIGAFSGIKG